ncbi:hypothetical protein E3J84_04815 [Candidatus Aerophobetes bacterium]|uniref:Uncharacterized protein n=1 Tax=Aerophobetes bacterium TaxID=2030807 RepID=A0A523RVB3_UNCAE|nr:MAG: hypothetical protein E3J84_04815 [Candidatus Aerophobetes bacterium]
MEREDLAIYANLNDSGDLAGHLAALGEGKKAVSLGSLATLKNEYSILDRIILYLYLGESSPVSNLTDEHKA